MSPCVVGSRIPRQEAAGRAGGRACEPTPVFVSGKKLAMPYDIRRFAVLVSGLMCLVLPASTAGAQTRPHRFEIAAGTMYGFQDPERPLTAGWIVSSGFHLGQRWFVVEGAWHRDAYALEHPWDVDEVFRERLQSRYWTLMGGVRGGGRHGLVAPYYQVLAGGFAAHFRRDNEWPASIDTEAENAACGGYVDGVLVHPCLHVPYPAFDEERSAGFVMQPGVGVDVHVWRRFTLRLAADLPILAGGDYVVFRPKLSARVVVTLGR